MPYFPLKRNLVTHGTISTITSNLQICFRHPIMPAVLANNIRALRFQRGMTQEELALRVGVSRQTIMSIERGATNPSVTLAFMISMALEAPVTEVFSVQGSLVPV